jgi:hypothetical protein
MNMLTRTVALSALALGACSSSHQLPANYAPTQAAISAADAVGAQNEPRAALHLKMARDQVVQAQSLANRGKDREASIMLDRARTDAEMALMVSREVQARSQAQEAKREVEGLSTRGN